jgi:hypothetical protein
MRALFLFAVSGFISLLCPTPTWGTSFQLVQTIHNPSPQPSADGFGYSVAASGNVVLVGAPYEDTGGTSSGSVHVFDSRTGAFIRTIDNPFPTSVNQFGDKFGWSVDLSGSTALISARTDDPGGVRDAGAAYLFDITTGDLLQTFTDPSPRETEEFGWSVSQSSSLAVVGSSADGPGGTGPGSAHVYDLMSGNLDITLSHPNPSTGGGFGLSVAIADTSVLVGAPFDDVVGTNSGRAYLFDPLTGSLLQTFNNPNASFSDTFGRAVAMDANHVLIAAPLDDLATTDGGTVYLFDATTGELLHTFISPNPSVGDKFGGVEGRAVAISGGIIAIGAQFDDTAAADAGAVYLFDAITGDLLQTIINPDAVAAGDFFGWSVSLSDQILVVGADRDDLGTTNAAGTVYVYAIPEPSTALLLALGLAGIAAGRRRVR